MSGDLEIVVGAQPTRLTKEQKTQHELELALKRRLNRDIKDRQLLMHKVSLLCLLARSMKYNRLLADTTLMEATLKLLPSRNAYPTEKGVELKYLQSFVTWFKTAIKLLSQDLYASQAKVGSKRAIIEELLAQIKRKEARCKQDMIFIFIVLARGMGMNCRLIVNLQPMALRPQASDLIPIKLKQEEKNKSQTIKTEKEEEEEEVEELEELEEQKASSLKPVESKPRAAVKRSASKSSPKPNSSSNIPAKAAKKDTEELKSSNSSAKKPKEEPKSSSKTAAAESRSNSQKSKIKHSDSNSESELKAASSNSKAKPKTNAQKMNVEHKASSSRSATTAAVKADAKSSTGKPVAAPKPIEVANEVKPQLMRLKRAPKLPEAGAVKRAKQQLQVEDSPVARRTRKASVDKEKAEEVSYPAAKVGSPVIPKILLRNPKAKKTKQNDAENAKPGGNQLVECETRPSSKSSKTYISTQFLKGDHDAAAASTAAKSGRAKITKDDEPKRELRTRQQKAKMLAIPQLDGGDDSLPLSQRRIKLQKLQKSQSQSSGSTSAGSTPSPAIKKAPVLPKVVQHLRKDRRVLSTDDECVKEKKKTTASDMWVEVWSEVEEQWICIDLFKGKLHCVDTIRVSGSRCPDESQCLIIEILQRNASSSLAYVFAFQDDLSLKDVTARYCPSWTTTVRKSRVEKSWLDETLAPYLGRRTKRDIREDEELRRIHSDKPLPKSISEFKDHPLYALERHLLKFQGIYPPDAPTLGFIRGEAVYARDCVHLLHSREIWLKSARVVKLGEQPYKVVKARPKWDKVRMGLACSMWDYYYSSSL